MKVVTFGELLLRLASPAYSRLFQDGFLEATFCGSEANVAVSLAMLGTKSAFVSKLPEGDVGDAALRSLRSFGVDVSGVSRGLGRMGLYYLEKGASQRPSKVIYDRGGSSFALMKSNEYDWDEILEGAGWFHWSGINPALSDEVAKTCRDACEAARRRDITVSCDLNYRAMLWSRERAQVVMQHLLPLVDVCIANEEDAETALGIKTRGVDIGEGKVEGHRYVDTARAICKQFGCEIVATTLRESFSASRNGWSAVLYVAKDDEAFLSRRYDIHIVDRVGAGDSFAAALIYALSSGAGGQRAVDFAAAASCLKHSIEGDFNRVSVQEVEALLASGGSGRVVR